MSVFDDWNSREDSIYDDPAYTDVDVSMTSGLISLHGIHNTTGHGHKLAELPGDHADILRDMLADMIRQRQGHASGHDYLSTACLHEQHDQCRRSCKFCPAECSCDCAHPDTTESLMSENTEQHHFTQAEAEALAPPTCPDCGNPAKQHWADVSSNTEPDLVIRGRISCLTPECPRSSIPSFAK